MCSAWISLIAVFIGWILGILTIYIGRIMEGRSKRGQIAEVLVAEIKSNENHLSQLKQIHDSKSPDEISDLKPISAPFNKSAYKILIDKLGVFWSEPLELDTLG